MPVFKFSSQLDALFLRARDAECTRLYRRPRRWLVSTNTITKNIYGEPGAPISGADGATSIPSTRTLTSATSDFTAAGVAVGDILEVFEESIKDSDNGRYVIDQVVSTHVLKISSNWPVGSMTALGFTVHFLNERYVEFAQLVPFVVKLDPSTEILTKWGIEEKRDAIVILSYEICNNIALTPKIGDRFIYQYNSHNIHYEMKEMRLLDQWGDSGYYLHYVGGAMKSDIKLPV